MTWQKNIHKQEMIERFGQTAGLPLFDSRPTTSLPDWIWNGNGISAEVYRKMELKFSDDAKEYLRALLLLGGQATDHEVKDAIRWDLHIVSARRNDLKKLGVVVSYPGKKKPGPYGMANTIWFVNYNQLYKIINEVQ